MSYRVIRQRVRQGHQFSEKRKGDNRHGKACLYNRKKTFTADDFQYLVQCYDMDFVLQDFHRKEEDDSCHRAAGDGAKASPDFVTMTSWVQSEQGVLDALYKKLPESWIVPQVALYRKSWSSSSSTSTSSSTSSFREASLVVSERCDDGAHGATEDRVGCTRPSTNGIVQVSGRPIEHQDKTAATVAAATWLVTPENKTIRKPCLCLEDVWGVSSGGGGGGGSGGNRRSVETLGDMLVLIGRLREAVVDSSNLLATLQFVSLSREGGEDGCTEEGAWWQQETIRVLRALVSIEDELRELDAMVGMTSLKSALAQQIMYFVQGMQDRKELKHVVITGPPGSGKTEVAKLLGRIYARLGVFSAGTGNDGEEGKETRGAEGRGGRGGRVYFKKATRADLIAGYVGQTALKTQAVMEECCTGEVAMLSSSSSPTGGGSSGGGGGGPFHPSSLRSSSSSSLGGGSRVGNGTFYESALEGKESTRVSGGILFIDEAYALGSKDDFSKEFADTLCEGMTDRSDRMMVILAGYAKDLDERFFTLNPGLSSRFVWRFDIAGYSGAELCKIFERKLKLSAWSWSEDVTRDNAHVRWFESHVRDFPHAGRDMEVLFMKTKIAKSKHSFLAPPSSSVPNTGQAKRQVRELLVTDLDHGFRLFQEHKDSQYTRSQTETSRHLFSSMYS